jgi:hypothetical protein
MTQPTSLYQQGPSVALFAGPYNFMRGDKFQVVIQNNLYGKFQTLANRMFNMMGLGYLLPTSVQPTQPNSLISV